MSVNNLVYSKPYVDNQLDTFNYTIASAGMHSVYITITVVPPTSAQVQITQNSTPVYTSTAFSATQQNLQLKFTLNCAVSDVISVIVSSSAAIDQMPNNIKSTVTLTAGI